MPVRDLVERFYDDLWNARDLEVAVEILDEHVTFRGSVGVGARGRDEVCSYVTMVTTALADYRCDILEVVVDGDRAAAKVMFSGCHVGEFLGHAPTGRRVEWIGTAFFTAEAAVLREIWVLGDLVSLHAQLAS